MAEVITNDDLDKNKKSGTGFVNLQKVLQANQGSGLGQSVSSQTQQIAQRIGGEVQKAGDQFQNKTQQAFQPFAGGQQFASQAVQAPTGLSDNDVNRFKTITQGTYTGPKQLENIESLQSGVTGLQNLAKLGQSSGGRQALLGTLFTRPQYSTGQKRLDALLLQADPNQAKALGELQNTASRTNRQFLNTSGLAANEGNLKERQARELGQSVTQQLQTEREARDQEQLDKLANLQKNELDIMPKYRATEQALLSGTISKQDLDRLGLGDVLKEGTNIYNLSPLEYLKTQEAQMPLNVRDTISQDEALRINALAKLAGQGPMYDDLSKLGAYKPSSQTFDVERFKRDLDNAAANSAGLQQQIQRLGNIRMLLDTGEHRAANPGGVADLVNKYGSEQNALNALFAQSGHVYNPGEVRDLTNQIQEKLDQYRALNPGRTIQIT